MLSQDNSAESLSSCTCSSYELCGSRPVKWSTSICVANSVSTRCCLRQTTRLPTASLGGSRSTQLLISRESSSTRSGRRLAPPDTHSIHVHPTSALLLLVSVRPTASKRRQLLPAR